MFIVTNQRTARVGGQRCLARARQTKEDGGMAIGTNIGRTVHGHHALYRQKVIENAKHGLLHFARISGATNENKLLGKVDRDNRFAAATMTCRVCTETWQIDDCIFGHKAG